MLVKGLTNVVEVSAGSAYSFARRADGSVWAWGANWFGQFADGTTTDRSLPAPIPGLTRIVKMSAPLAMAVRDDGTVWDWGDLEGGPPVQITGLPFIKDIAKMDDVAYALAADGQIWAWQYGPVEDDPRFLGRLPDSIVDVRVPAPVLGLTDVVAIGSGPQCTYALKRDGSVWTWGENSYSGLGNGSGFSAVPIQVLGLGGSSTTQATLGTGAVVDSWILQNFTPEELLNDALIEDTADPDGDGMENLMEYALGQDPRIAGTGQPVGRIDLIGNAAQSLGLFSVPSVELIAGKHYLALSVRRLGGIRQDIEYLIEVSTDRVQWQSGDPHTVTILDTAETLEAYSATSLEDAAVQYIRLRVHRKSDAPDSGVTSAVIAADLAQVPQVRFSRAGSRSPEGAGSAALGLTIFPASASAMTVPLTVTGTATPGSDFTTIKSITIPAGQTSVSVPVALLQDLKLEAEESVLFTLGPPPGLATLGLPAQHQLTIVDDEMAPGIFPQAASRLVGSGDNLTFTSTPVGSPVPILQWLKNGRIIPGANAAELELKLIQLQDAGAYTLKASNAVGTFTSSAADLAVVERAASSQTIPTGKAAVLSARFSGAGLAFQWRKDGTALSDLTRYTGLDSPTLRIKKADVALDSGTYTCRVSRDGVSVVSGDIRLSVLSEAPVFTSSAVIQLPSVVIGSSYGPVPLSSYLNPAPNRTPTSWSATVLPKGLKLDVKTGEISGIVTEVKTVSLTLKATNLEGTATASANLTVHPLPDGSAGSWIGLLARSAEVNGNLGGRLDLMVSTAGSFSGKLLNGTSSHSFTGTLTTTVAGLFPTGIATIKRPRPPDLTLSFVIDSAANRLQNAQICDGDNTAAISGWRNVWSEAVPPPSGYLGAAHTLAIEPPADPALPQGYGFASFTVKPAGTLTVMGKLADGVDFSTAGFLGPNGEVLITQTSATADSVGGILLVTPGTGPLFADTTISGTLTWSRMKQAPTSRLYRDGFVPTSVSVFGGRYLLPASTVVVMNLEDRSDNARLSFAGGNIGAPLPLPNLLLQIKPGGGVLRPTNNPRNTTLVIKPSTGELSGAFSLVDPNPLIPATMVTRKVTYQGQIVTRDGTASGYGHFQLAELPSLGPPKTTPLNSPMLSGSMRLEKSPPSTP